MRIEGIKTIFRMKIPFDKPDKNGVVYTREAVERAFSGDLSGIPVWYTGDNSRLLGHTVGVRIVDAGESEMLVEVDAVIRFGGTGETATIEGNKICDYQIIGFGIADEEDD